MPQCLFVRIRRRHDLRARSQTRPHRAPAGLLRLIARRRLPQPRVEHHAVQRLRVAPPRLLRAVEDGRHTETLLAGSHRPRELPEDDEPESIACSDPRASTDSRDIDRYGSVAWP